MTAQIHGHRDDTRIDGDPMLAEAIRVPCCRLDLSIDADPLARVIADIRRRTAGGEARPVLARHMTALGLDGVLLALARES